MNSYHKRIKRFAINKQNKDIYFEYMFIDSGKIIGFLAKEPPLMTIWEELKVFTPRN